MEGARRRAGAGRGDRAAAHPGGRAAAPAEAGRRPAKERKLLDDCARSHDGRNLRHASGVVYADGLNLTGLSRGANDLALRARSKKLSPIDVQDATFTITNPGVFGSLMGTPIIPVGTTAILGLGAIEKRPKVITGADGEDTIAIRTCAYFSLSFDHRVVDGADADRFMADLKKTLEAVQA